MAVPNSWEHRLISDKVSLGLSVYLYCLILCIHTHTHTHTHTLLNKLHKMGIFFFTYLSIEGLLTEFLDVKYNKC